jgi:hypothetical protein
MTFVQIDSIQIRIKIIVKANDKDAKTKPIF